jgi:hypothetical protein
MTQANVTNIDATKQEAVDKARAEHGDVAVFDTRHGLVIFKTPPLAAYERFTDKIALKDERGGTSAAMRELCFACVVEPDVTALRALFEKMPALPLKAGKSLQSLAGADLEGEIKKA